MGKKFTLGKGLSALIPEDIVENDQQYKNGKILIPLNEIKNDNNQPRKTFDGDKIAELTESIRAHGIIQPLILRKSDDGFYIIVAGERRWRAAKMAGLKDVPAIVMEISEKSVLEISLIENIQRQDLNPIEEASAYKKLLSEFSLTQDDLSKRIGKSRTAITNTIRLMNLDERVQQYIIEGIITEGHGRTLLGIKDKDLQYELSQKAIDERLSVRELERVVKRILDGKITEKKEVKNELNPYYKEIKNQLHKKFNVK